MIVYTPDEIFNMLATVSCETDLIELDYYVSAHRKSCTLFDLQLFEKSIDMLYEALVKRI